MEKDKAIRLFNDVKIRVHWDDEQEKGTLPMWMLLQYSRKVLMPVHTGES